jgi:4-hydroxybenzoate polyprenyltransferase
MSATLNSPLPARLWAWAEERFPLKNAVLILAIYAAALLVGRALTYGGALTIAPIDAAGFLAAWAFFLMLRVFDEHKDYELDLQNHPQRVLQSGLITLGHLKVLWVVAVALQLGVSLWHDHGGGPVVWLWLAVFGWSLLMAKEFFAHTWLSRRLVLYAFSHMIIMPMAVLWMTQMGADAGWPPRPEAFALAGMAFCSGFAFELARKLRAPEDERPTVDSYTKIFGTTGAPIAVLVVLLGSAAVQVWLLVRLASGTPVVALAAVGLALALAVWALAGFARRPTSAAAKRAEAVAGLTVLVQYVVMIATVVAQRGVSV